MSIASTILTRELAASLLTMPFIFGGAYLIWQTKKIRCWRDARGKILSFQEKREGFNYWILIRYSYLAHGILLEGSRITVCDTVLASGLVPVRKLARLFPVGKEVAVYFDENHPKKCILKKNGYLVPVLIFAFGVIAEVFFAWWVGEGNVLPPNLRPTITHI